MINQVPMPPAPPMKEMIQNAHLALNDLAEAAGLAPLNKPTHVRLEHAIGFLREQLKAYEASAARVSWLEAQLPKSTTPEAVMPAPKSGAKS